MKKSENISHSELKSVFQTLTKEVNNRKNENPELNNITKIVENIIDAAPLPMGLVRNRQVVYVNPTLCRLTGYSIDELIGKSISVLYGSKKEFEDVGRELYKHISEEKVYELRTIFKIKSGNTYRVLMNATLLDRNNPSLGVVFGAIDISEKSRYEQMLRDNREKFMTFFNNINDTVLVHPWQEEGFGNFTEVNDFAVKRYGYTREEFTGLSVPDISVAADVKKYSSKEERYNLLETGSKFIETYHITKSGEEFPVEINSKMIELEGKKFILSVVRDISERKTSQMEIEESEKRHREMFELSPEAMVILDKKGFIMKCNNSFYELSGWDPEEIENRHFINTDLLRAKQIPEYLKTFHKLIIKREKSTIDFEWNHKTKGKRHGKAHIGPLLKHGKISGLQIYISDTTASKDFENKLIEAKVKAEESDRLKSSFLAIMSHELRTPLNAVIGFSDLISSSKDIESIREMNGIVNDNGKRLLKIIESIFDLSNLETGEAKLQKEIFEIDRLFAGLSGTLKTLIVNDKAGTIKVLYEPDRKYPGISLYTDRTKLEQLLSNLLANAVKYTSKGEIKYGYAVKGDTITFFVRDTGIGIPESKQAIIFDKFRQVEETYSRTYGGVGLGLSICKELSTLLGGKIWVESKVNKGSCFYFELPGSISSENLSTSENEKDIEPPECSDLQILIVEDEESNYLFLESILKKTRADLIWARSGEESLEIIRNNPGLPIVLMDIRMPGMDGYEATREIKKLSPSTKVVAQTAYAMESDMMEAYSSGCDGYISKPIKKETLFKLISDQIKNS